MRQEMLDYMAVYRWKDGQLSPGGTVAFNRIFWVAGVRIEDIRLAASNSPCHGRNRRSETCRHFPPSKRFSDRRRIWSDDARLQRVHGLETEAQKRKVGGIWFFDDSRELALRYDGVGFPARKITFPIVLGDQ
ncbi:hypothetical protein PAXINDRAFT_172794 [Paxillus involutus ATCC 200175]|uniref:Uncharacterized protein n=1 Tax=Paxillus involutus ATCC 200175 TaxID=664439 RepID=A0A0C9TNF4_PAXIN|nr:hypothetical protein PAXINDRAFT_172794 [Paxillus involutus ATCC 200175]